MSFSYVSISPPSVTTDHLVVVLVLSTVANSSVDVYLATKPNNSPGGYMTIVGMYMLCLNLASPR